jgi:hypothetical protein
VCGLENGVGGQLGHGWWNGLAAYAASLSSEEMAELDAPRLPILVVREAIMTESVGPATPVEMRF